MQTEAEFVAERIQSHREALADSDSRFLLELLEAPPTPVSQAEKDAYCLPTGWLWRRQAE